MSGLKDNTSVRWVLWLCAVPVVVTLSGCTVGPNYAQPQIPVPSTWHSPLEDSLGPGPANPQTLASWWTTLDDPVLSGLIERAVAGNLDVRKALSRIRQARAQRKIVAGGRLPSVNTSVSATSSRTDTNVGFDTHGEVYSANLSAAWNLDLFGGVRRAIEAATADLEASQEDYYDALVALAAETALNYLEVRTYQARLIAAEAGLQIQQESYALTQWRSEAGLDDELAVSQARYNLESTRAQIPTLRTGLQEATNRIAVLLGQQPGELQQLLEKPQPIPVPPAEVAVGVPAEVMRRRPDVRRAERDLAAQTARVGVATADLYPRLTLNGSIGIETLSLRNPSSSRTWTARGGPGVSWPAFDATIRPNIDVQSELQEQALIQYEATILSSLEEVENAISAYGQEQQRRDNLRRATEAAQAAAELARNKYQAGLTDFATVLDAERSLVSLQDQLHQSDGTVTANVIRLYQALGGGWTSLADAPTPEPAKQS
jgi:NodT family efflux transporter outer membrane factor (OMF) lipoprotein